MSQAPKATQRLPKLPTLLERKIYKTGQTRGADDDVIYQNRVSRGSTVLIPYACWHLCSVPPSGEAAYQKGFIVLLSPSEYFNDPKITANLTAKGLAIGTNALVFYETRQDWIANTPDALNWTPGRKRTSPLGGQYVARIPATTAATNAGKIVRGFNVTKMKGAGIRVYEYASTDTIKECRLQLEALFWLCCDSDKVAVSNGMTAEEVATRKAAILKESRELGLLEISQLTEACSLNSRENTICPLCREELSGQEFFNRMEQAEGRIVPDLTVTQVNLFHISELRIGVLNHRRYNVAWGHHHCNVVAKDSGIRKTLEWMSGVLKRNVEEGHYPAENNAS